MNIPKPKTYRIWKKYGPDCPFIDISDSTVLLNGNLIEHNELNWLSQFEPNASFTAGLNNHVQGDNSVIIGGTNNNVTGNNSAIIGGRDINLNENNILVFDGDIRLHNNRQVLQELNELRQELHEIKELVTNHINGIQNR